MVLAQAEWQRLVEAPQAKTGALLFADINFNVSGLFSAPAPQDQVSDRPASEELPAVPVLTSAAAFPPAPTPASAATKER